MSLNKLNQSLSTRGIKTEVSSSVKKEEPLTLPVITINGSHFYVKGEYHNTGLNSKGYPMVKKFTVEDLTIKAIDRLQALIMLNANHPRLVVNSDYNFMGLSHISIKTVSDNATQSIPDKVENGKVVHGKPSVELYKSFWDVESLDDFVSIYGWKNGIKIPILRASEILKHSDQVIANKEKQKGLIQLSSDHRKLFTIDNKDHIIRLSSSGKVFVNGDHVANVAYSPEKSSYWLDLTDHNISQFFNGLMSETKDGTFTLDQATMSKNMYHALWQVFNIFSTKTRKYDKMRFSGNLAYIGNTPVMKRIDNALTSHWIVVPIKHCVILAEKPIQRWIGRIINENKLVTNYNASKDSSKFVKKYSSQFLRLNPNYTMANFYQLLLDHGEEKFKELILDDKMFILHGKGEGLKIPDLL